MTTKIVLNGVEYGSADEMPAPVRTQYERVLRMLPDADGNGVPDILENPSEPRMLTRVSGPFTRPAPAPAGSPTRPAEITVETSVTLAFLGHDNALVSRSARGLLGRVLFFLLLGALVLLVLNAWPR